MRQLFRSSVLGGWRLLLFLAALAGAHRQGKGGTVGMAASCGARARAPSRGRTGGERRRPGAGQGGAAGASRAGRGGTRRPNGARARAGEEREGAWATAAALQEREEDNARQKDARLGLREQDL
jgi:hypothetical protein